MVTIMFADMQFFPDDGCAIVCFVSKIKLPSGHMVHLFHVNGRASRKNLKKKLQKSAAKCTPPDVPDNIGRASSSYFFLFFYAYSYCSYFLAISSYFSHFTYNKQIFVRDLNILSLFKYVVYRVH